MKIPIYESTQTLQPAYINEDAATAVGRAMEGFGKGLMVAGGNITEMSENQQKIKLYQYKMDEIKANNEVASKIIEFKGVLNEKRVDLERYPDQEQYEHEADKFFKDTSKKVIDGTVNPMVRDILKKKFGEEYLQWSATSMTKGNKLFVDSIKAQDINRFNNAINAGDEDMFKAAVSGMRGNIAGGIYDADTGAKEIAKYEAQFKAKKENQAYDAQQARLITDPGGLELDLRLRLLDKEIPDQGKRTELELRAAGIQRSEESRKQAQIEKEIKAESDRNYAKLNERIRKGENVTPEIYRLGPAGDRTLLQADYDKLLGHIDTLAKSGPVSDPDVARDIVIRSSSAVPTISESEINGLMKGGRLSTDDGEKALNRIRTTNNSLKNESEQKNNQNYSDALKRIHEGLGISGMLLQLTEKLNPTQQGLVSRANAELWDRSVGRGGKENAMDVAKEILPEYQRALTGEAKLSIDTLGKLINIKQYPSIDSLTSAWETKKITKEEWTRKAKFFQEIQIQNDLIQSQPKSTGEKLR